MWLGRNVLGPVAIAIGWTAYVWFTGRTWRHQVRHRYVRREVRATGQTLLAVVVALLVWQPVVVATVLAVGGASLVTTALVWRHRDQLRELAAHRFPQLDRRGPIRVQATVGETRRLTHSHEGR